MRWVGGDRLTRSRKVSAKDCAQIVANRDSELGYAFAIVGYALLLDALLSFVSPDHCGRIPYWPLLVVTLAQGAHFGRILGPHLGRFLGPQEHRRSALSLLVKSAVR
jgi:hypothetical protein